MKKIADRHKRELGFVPLPSLQATAARGWLFVAECDGQIVGFLQPWFRRDGQVTIHAFCSEMSGAGTVLIAAVVDAATGPIVAKCPIDLPSNAWYASHGFTLRVTEAGKRRALNVWTIEQEPAS